MLMQSVRHQRGSEGTLAKQPSSAHPASHLTESNPPVRSVNPGKLMSGLVSCTGNQFCGFSNIDTKQQAWKVAEHLESVFDFPNTVRMHWTGCPNTCGQIQVGEIGLLGTQVKNPAGAGKVPAVDVYVGGRIGADSHLAEVWKAGVRCDDELIPTLEALVEERFGAVRRPTPLPNPMRFKSMKVGKAASRSGGWRLGRFRQMPQSHRRPQQLGLRVSGAENKRFC